LSKSFHLHYDVQFYPCRPNTQDCDVLADIQREVTLKINPIQKKNMYNVRSKGTEEGTEFATNNWKDLMEIVICYNIKLWDTDLTKKYMKIVYP
jgi:hypothetical protein